MAYDFKIEELAPQQTLAIRETAAMAEIPAKIAGSFRRPGPLLRRTAHLVRRSSVRPVHSWSDAATVMDVGFPVPPGAEGEGRIQPMILPGGRVVTGTHIGPYDTIVETYTAMTDG